MGDPRITYNGINIDLTQGRTGLTMVHKQNRNQNESASGKIETINIFGRFDYEFDSFFSEQLYFDLMAWWSWARQGKGFSFALDSDNTGYTKLDAAAASGQKVIPVTTTSDFTTGDFCLQRATDNDDEFEIIEIDSVSAGVSVTAVDNLKYSYTANALGSEKITNGGFPANTDGWTAGSSATLASVGGGKAGNCLQVTENGDANPYAYQDNTVIPGESYIIDGYVKAGTEATYRIQVQDKTNGFVNIIDTNDLEETAGDWSTSFKNEYISPTSCVEIRYKLRQTASAAAGTTTLFDSITHNKINADTLTHKDYFAKVLTTETDFRPTLTGVKDKTTRYYKHNFRFTENL